jgi:hypothetical protein
MKPHEKSPTQTHRALALANELTLNQGFAAEGNGHAA